MTEPLFALFSHTFGLSRVDPAFDGDAIAADLLAASASCRGSRWT